MNLAVVVNPQSLCLHCFLCRSGEAILPLQSTLMRLPAGIFLPALGGRKDKDKKRVQRGTEMIPGLGSGRESWG